MKYRINRASHIYDAVKEPKPCEGAYFEGMEWHIDINSLEELIALIEKVGRISVINYSIEIDDAWKE